MPVNMPVPSSRVKTATFAGSKARTASASSKGAPDSSRRQACRPSSANTRTLSAKTAIRSSEGTAGRGGLLTAGGEKNHDNGHTSSGSENPVKKGGSALYHLDSPQSQPGTATMVHASSVQVQGNRPQSFGGSVDPAKVRKMIEATYKTPQDLKIPGCNLETGVLELVVLPSDLVAATEVVASAVEKDAARAVTIIGDVKQRNGPVLVFFKKKCQVREKALLHAVQNAKYMPLVSLKLCALLTKSLAREKLVTLELVGLQHLRSPYTHTHTHTHTHKM